ncbi:DNA-binding PadR family transcriptional regulator [Tamaricihabitans halophyticus]|uniref:DNA-binding PadR family transcriptional regulator n=1 Tax=Tamaricihabitans halophyticus TaxID=1262583 RepID=A0A4V2SUW5_9PSEU|nr:PadR family transcriptional regulator [Tamaricihabitans halophyticus]TCP56176.1 DNA-binding PadR family transcriptional regulator [Tamaricihabitans halophyticus]
MNAYIGQFPGDTPFHRLSRLASSGFGRVRTPHADHPQHTEHPEHTEFGIDFDLPPQIPGRPPGPPRPPFPPGGPWQGHPGGPGFPPGPPGPHGPGQRGPGGRRGGRGRRGKRGDVRAAILALLAERPMHGYEMIQEISERSGQLWRPSPGSIYPTLQLLTDEGLISVTEGGGKRRYELTEDGRTAAEALEEKAPWEQIAKEADPDYLDIREAAGQLREAMLHVVRAGSQAQLTKATEVLNRARRELYAILGSDPSELDTEDDTGGEEHDPRG